MEHFAEVAAEETRKCGKMIVTALLGAPCLFLVARLKLLPTVSLRGAPKKGVRKILRNTFRHYGPGLASALLAVAYMSIADISASAQSGANCRAPGAASFNCAKATTPVELAICHSQELGREDCLLGYVYRDASDRARANGSAATLANEQLGWLKGRDNQCGASESCLLDATRERALALISAFQLETLGRYMLQGVYARSDFSPAAQQPTPATQTQGVVSQGGDEVSAKGLEYLKQSGTEWKLVSSQDPMTDTEVLKVLSEQTNDQGLVVQITGYCTNDHFVQFEAIFLDSSGNGDVDFGQNLDMGGAGMPPRVQVQRRYNDDTPDNFPLLVGQFRNVLKISILPTPAAPENLRAQFKALGFNYNAENVWRYLVKVDTSLGAIVLKIPFFDPSIQKMMASCSS